MCVVSMVTDHYRDKWPLPIYPVPQPGVLPVQSPAVIITPEQFAEYLELKRKAEEYDKRTNQPDCAKPEIVAWEEYCRNKAEQYRIHLLGQPGTQGT